MRLCIDCIFLSGVFCAQSINARLDHDLKRSEISPVDGKPIIKTYPLDRLAFDERTKGRCGMEATLFQPKEKFAGLG